MAKRKKIEAFFVPKNLLPEFDKIYESPSGRYSLLVRQYKTTPEGWNYTEGIAEHASDPYGSGVPARGDRRIAVVHRNYSNFHFGFVEDHPNGHDYLLCGEEYQGFTVIELDTGARSDWLSIEAEKGFGFCPAEYTYRPEVEGIDKEGPFMEVLGCYWACPYERRLHDFSDPLSLPWPLLKESYADEEEGFDSIQQELRNG